MWVADRVDEALEAYREAHGIARPWETRERVVVAITGAPGGDDVIRRAARMAARARSQLLGVHVRSADGLRGTTGDALGIQRALLQELGGEYHELASADPAGTLVQFARAENATQIVLGASRQSRWTHLLRGSVITNVLKASGDIDVHVISSDPERDDVEREAVEAARRRPRGAVLSPRRRIVAWTLAILAPPLLTLVLANVRETLTLPSDLLMFLLIVVVVAALGGFVPAFVCAITGFLLANWYFTPPYYEFTISEGENLVALVIFLLVGGVVSLLVATASRRTADAARARAEAETLAALERDPVGVGRPAPAARRPAPGGVRRRARRRAERGGRRLVDGARGGRRLGAGASRGRRRRRPVARHRGPGALGRALGDDDREVLKAFAGQVAIAVQQRELRADAERAEGLAEANELRTALLAAVSHDLRTPLSSIKASVTSLLQRDVDFTPAATRELLETIDEGTDRLNHLVGNLLDMSRLQTGALQLVMRDVGLDEVLAGGRRRADAGRSGRRRRRRDAATRASRRRVARARHRQRGRERDRVVARHRARADRGVRGPASRGAPGGRPWSGHPAARREDVFRPFQRLGDRSNGSGVGLGLAVARGFVEAMGGRIAVEDTPGRRRHHGDQLWMPRDARPGRRRRAADPARPRHQPPRARLRRRPRARRRARARRSPRRTIPTSWSSTSGFRGSTAST